MYFRVFWNVFNALTWLVSHLCYHLTKVFNNLFFTNEFPYLWINYFSVLTYLLVYILFLYFIFFSFIMNIFLQLRKFAKIYLIIILIIHFSLREFTCLLNNLSNLYQRISLSVYFLIHLFFLSVVSS